MSLLKLEGLESGPDGAGWDFWWSAFLRGASLPPVVGARSIKIVDLFCGAGGFGLGASLAARAHGLRAHFERIVDVDRGALEVYRRNLSVGKAFDTPVSSLVDYSISERAGKHHFAYPPEIVLPDFEMNRSPDLLIAGPPCQGHSNLNNHTRRDDPRNELLFCTVALAVALQSRIVVIENVASIENAKGDLLSVARDLLTSSGYEVDGAVIASDRLGWPQTRRRFFLTAIKSDLASGAMPPLPDRPSKEVMWAIQDLLNLDEPVQIFDTPPRQSEANRARISWLFENGKHELANSERPDCHKDGTTYGAVYGRMYQDRPAPTITTGFGTPGQGRFIHPTEPRLITPHEAARIQAFPDSYRFFLEGATLKRKELSKWIGDAVPPFLGFHVCKRVLGALTSKR